MRRGPAAGTRSVVGVPLRALRGREALVPALVATALFVFLGASEGGYLPLTWYPAALFLLALLMVALVALPARKRVPRLVWVAVGLFGAYTAWTFLSIAWAGQQGDAWTGANRTLMYACVFALFALWPIPARAGMLVLGALGLGVAGVGLVELLRLGAAADPAGFLIGGGRLGQPVGYTNGNAALWTIGLIPCLLIASRREVPVPLRGLSLGAAGLLLGLALMTQSRGWIIALPLALVVLVAVTPGRVRLLLGVAVLGASAAVMAGPAFGILEQYEAGQGLGTAADRATRTILLTALALTMAGTLAAILDLRFPLSSRAARRVGVTAGVAVAFLIVLGAGAFVVREGNPVARASDAWADFKRGYAETAPDGTPVENRGNSSRLTRSLGTNRYDFWTLAWRQFEERPLVGNGAENFQRDYLRRGKSGEQPRYAHSLPLGVLSQTGLVGAALLLGALGVALVAAAAAIRRGSPTAGAAAGGALATFAYWLLHASGDWLWEFPGLAAPAIALLGMAIATAPRRPARGAMTGRADPLVRRPAVAAGVTVAALLPAASLLMPWLATREVERAGAVWSSRPVEAYARLDRAASLDPLSAEAKVTEGSIALQLGDLPRAETAFRAALERDPDTPYTTLQLAIVASQQGRMGVATTYLERARRLSPHDLVVSATLKRARSGKRLDPDAIERLYLQRQRF